MNRPARLAGMLLAVSVLAVGCPKPETPELAEGIFAPLGEVLPSASVAEQAAFEAGREFMGHRFTPEEGLGPSFNVTSCGACHERPTFGGSGPRYRDFLLVAQEFGDGSQNFRGKSGVQLQYSLHSPVRISTEPEVNIMATRNAPPFFGAGLIAEIPAEEIRSNADPEDSDGDGISGRVNTLNGFVGRFGRKAQFPSLENFVRGPLFNHAGITSDPLSNERRAQLPVPSANSAVDRRREPLGGDGSVAGVRQAQAGAPDVSLEDDDDVMDPELSEDDLFNLVSFAMLLAAPEPGEPTEASLAGEQIFEQAQCAACHIPALESHRGLIPLYSDLLIHDMGEENADGLEMEAATASEFRTQPLWGVAATSPYMHDGSADTYEEAIDLHGGEAAGSRAAFSALDDVQKLQLFAFLDSLGGASQRSRGLIPPATPVGAQGTLGGPQRILSDGEEARFLAGRALFDGDFHREDGLGPTFNGDACRSCHFEPMNGATMAVGGAGPTDVDVIRQSIVDPVTGEVTAPPSGTLVHRHAADGSRPSVDPMANNFENRQTPSLFGMGLIELIAEGAILAAQDPEDADADGISGRAHILEDGRLGRMGWKAQVPNLAEFARDAMSAELGATVEPQEGLTFGLATDDDVYPDPEISAAELETLVFFMQELAAPSPSSTDVALEEMGRGLFMDTGCASCHTPSLPLMDGTPVNLFSDLLLHDVAPADYVGIPDGDASPREFRTPPLWGISGTAPYMHHGRAFTLEDAIAAHDSEAAAARDAYQALTAQERAALLGFLQSL